MMWKGLRMSPVLLMWNLFTCIQMCISMKTFYMEEKCGKTIILDTYGIHSGKVKPSRKGEYGNEMKCAVTIKTDDTHRINIVIKRLDIEFEPYCDDDYLTIYDGNSTDAKLIKGLPKRMCGDKKPGGAYSSTRNTLTIYFRSDKWYSEDGFEIIFTIFREAVKGQCFDGEFRCINNRCISESLKCDGWNNCGDYSDECRMSPTTVVAIVISIAIVTVIFIGAIQISRKISKKEKPVVDKKTQELHDDIHHKYQRSYSLFISPENRTDHQSFRLPSKIHVSTTAEGLPW